MVNIENFVDAPRTVSELFELLDQVGDEIANDVNTAITDSLSVSVVSTSLTEVAIELTRDGEVEYELEESYEFIDEEIESVRCLVCRQYFDTIKECVEHIIKTHYVEVIGDVLCEL